MFGYVTPCKMELKVKDFEKFKAYYCGLCRSIKSGYGNLPRAALNYDMTFLGILLDSLKDTKCSYKISRCIVHPVKKRLMIVDNEALHYAAACNVTLAYYKLLDNVTDDKSVSSRIMSLFLKNYLKKNSSVDFDKHSAYIRNSLQMLSGHEKRSGVSLDEVCDPFSDLTGYIISSYFDTGDNTDEKALIGENLYWLGYNLGKWIYIIDAWDDLEKDMKNNKFNILNKLYNINNLAFHEFKPMLEERVDFLLVSCASSCLETLDKLPLKKNHDLLYNILQYGLMEKMDSVFKRSGIEDAKSL